MNLLNALSSQLGVDPSTAQAVAGTVLGAVHGQLADSEDPKAAEGMAAAIPELGGWMAQAKALVAPAAAPAAPASGFGGMLGGLTGGGAAGALLGALGGEQARDMADLLAKALAAAPFLTGGQAPSASAGLLGALGRFA